MKAMQHYPKLALRFAAAHAQIQSAIDALEDLARPDAMPPSALRRE